MADNTQEQPQGNIRAEYNVASVGMNMDQSINQIKKDQVSYDILPGIYFIYNIISNKYYIGSSLNVHKRILNHKNLLLRNKHHSYKLQASYNKYGKDVFIFKSLEQFLFPENYSKDIKIEYLECFEEYYIKKYNSFKNGYNVSKIPRIIGNTNTPESIKKGIETRIKKDGYFVSEEKKEKISLALKNSEYFKKQQKLAALKRRKKIYQYDLEGNFIKEWDFINQASKELNIYPSSIRKNIYNITKKCKNFIFTYKKQNKVSPFIKETRKKRKRKNIIVVNNLTFDKKIFKNCEECANFFNLKESTVYTYITKNVIYKNTFKFSYDK